MELKAFIKQNRTTWSTLEDTLRNVSKTRKKKKLTPELIEQFHILYQRTSHHLSYSQTYYADEEVTIYLNELVSRAHNTFYQSQMTSIQQLKRFFGVTFVKLLSEQRYAILVAFFLFLIGALGSFISVIDDPLHIYSVLPQEIAYAVDPNQIGAQDGAIDSPAVSASIMTNNVQVAFLAFAGGISFGIFTAYVLINNGIILGALAALFWQHNKFYDFWAYIVPHGMIELTAIFIAGGAGLLMGYYLFVPGNYPRSIRLKEQAMKSVQLLLGTIPLFIIAGIIEGYITPAKISLEAKYAFAFFTVIALILYVWIGHMFLKRNSTTHHD